MSIKVVIVDDAPFIREVVRQLLSKNGIQVVGEAGDGVEAIAVVKREKPDVVLMDIVMPKKNGIEATIEILSILPGTRVVACSTADDQAMILRALDAGCCDFVTKPFDSARLIKIISGLKRKTKGREFMMSDIWFALKMLALTVAVVLVMQVHVGSRSLENHAYVFIQSSSVTEYLQKVGSGGVRMVGDAYHGILNHLHKNSNAANPAAKHRASVHPSN